MKGWSALLPILLLLGWGCAAQAPQVPLARSVAPGGEPRAPVEAQETVSPQQRVAENQTFVTLDGVPRYKIGPGDVLEILLARELAQEKLIAAVKANGMVSVAFLEAQVAGRTTEQAAEEIRRVLSPFYRQLGVDVLVKEYNSKRGAVLGAVGGKPGMFPLKGKTTLLDLLAEAGGPAPNADLERVRVIPQDGPPSAINLFRLLSEGNLIRDFVLDAGDVVFIPTRGPADEKKIFVLGEVKTPGAFPLIPGMRLSQALAQAGGPTEIAVLQSARVVRGGLGSPEIVEVNFRQVIEQGEQSQDLVLRANDLIVVPRSGIGNWNAFLAKLRPTLEFLTLPLNIPLQFQLLGTLGSK